MSVGEERLDIWEVDLIISVNLIVCWPIITNILSLPGDEGFQRGRLQHSSLNVCWGGGARYWRGWPDYLLRRTQESDPTGAENGTDREKEGRQDRNVGYWGKGGTGLSVCLSLSVFTANWINGQKEGRRNCNAHYWGKGRRGVWYRLHVCLSVQKTNRIYHHLGRGKATWVSQ